VERKVWSWDALPAESAGALRSCVAMLSDAGASGHAPAQASLGLVLLTAGPAADLDGAELGAKYAPQPPGALALPLSSGAGGSAKKLDLMTAGSAEGGSVWPATPREYEARQLFRLGAAKQRSAEACFQLGLAASFGNLGMERDEVKALEWCAARTCCTHTALAQTHMSKMHRHPPFSTAL